MGFRKSAAKNMFRAASDGRSPLSVKSQLRELRDVTLSGFNDLAPGSLPTTAEKNFMMHIAKTVVLICLASLGGCALDDAPSGPVAAADGRLRFGALTFEPCSLAGLGDSVEAQCATFTVPEDHDAPEGRTIDLAIALVPASGVAEPDPIVMIAGGPGQSALDSYPMMHDALSDARRSRSVLLMDARGTGQSHPLECRDEEGRNAFGDNEADQSIEAARAFALRCRDELSKTSDLRRYGTPDHIRDLEALRAALGIDTLNLIGISYGTRVAQLYARRYPEHTRTLTLDSVAPMSLVLGQEHARNLEDALEVQFARCQAVPACVDNLGDPAVGLRTLQARLKAGGLAPVRYRDPVSAEWREEVPTYGHLALLLRLYAYQPAATAMLPWVIHEALGGNYESLLAQARMIFGDLSEAITHGMQLSVICSEDPELAARAEDADTVLGNELIDFTIAQCEGWPKAERAADFRTPLDGDIPVLALSGEFDPVTPPRYGDEVVKGLANGRHLVLPGQGHSVLGIGCMPKLFAQFVEAADVTVIDDSCLQRLKAAPPFAGNFGWEP